MAELKITREIDKEIGKCMLNNFFEENDVYVDEEGTVLYNELNTENEIIFFEELKKQLNEEIDNHINHLKNRLKG